MILTFAQTLANIASTAKVFGIARNTWPEEMLN